MTLQYNGIQLLSIQGKDAIAYGRAVLDVLFSKEEQKKSLLYASKKSNKPGLNRELVSLLTGECACDTHNYYVTCSETDNNNCTSTCRLCQKKVS